jgi:hypothetical protein
MDIRKLVDAALVVVLMAAAAGQLPRLIQTVRVAQLQLLKESQSSKWGRPLLLPIHK